MKRIDIAIYGIQTDDNGKYYFDDTFSAESLTFDSLDSLIEYIKNDLREIEDDLKNGRLENEQV